MWWEKRRVFFFPPFPSLSPPHSNGTQHIFEADPDVAFFSVHRHDQGSFYPGTGAATEGGVGEGTGATLNVPWLTGGATDGDYLAAFSRVLLPAAHEYGPDMIIVSAGFDAAAGDPVGGCCASPALFAHAARALAGVAPCAFLLEGGYNLDATAACVEAVARAALGERPAPLAGGDRAALAPRGVALAAIHSVAVAQAAHWGCLRGLAGVAAYAPPRPPPRLVGEAELEVEAGATAAPPEDTDPPTSPRRGATSPRSPHEGRPVGPLSPRLLRPGGHRPIAAHEEVDAGDV